MYSLEHSQDLSPTAVICENLQRFGGTPQKGEPDPRAVWDRDEALAGLESILDTFVDEIAPDGTQLADERESLLWGFVNTLHMQTVRLDRAVDRLAPELKQSAARRRTGPRSTPGSWSGSSSAPATSAIVETRSSNFATPPPNGTAPTPAAPGDRGTARTSAAPRNSPPRRSMPATSSAPERTRRPRRTCRKARSSPSPAPSPSTTPTRSARRSIRYAASTRTWSWYTAAVRVLRRSRRVGPSPGACTRSSANRTGMPTARPLRSAATISC